MKTFKTYEISKTHWRQTNRQITDCRGNKYAITPTGAVVRISPERPRFGKSERRQVIKQRRAERAAA